MKKIQELDPKKYIIIQGAQLHNLKNVSVALPRNQLIVITGLSGSGKSSLAFDTLYAEGQRRYVESLSSYARQFMGRLNKPKVDQIRGIAPAIAVEQKVATANPKSTVGTRTEIYDYLKLLFSRVGVTYSPVSNEKVKKNTVSDVIDAVKGFKAGQKLLLLSPILNNPNRTKEEVFKIIKQQGFSRIYSDEKMLRLDQLEKAPTVPFELVVDRIVVRHEEDFYQRLSDAVDLAFYEGKGQCRLLSLEDATSTVFSNAFERDGIKFLTPGVHLFSFNNPHGACPNCEGFGDLMGIDPDLVVPDTSLSVYDHAIAPWRGTGYKKFYQKLINNAYEFDFPLHRPYFELTLAQKQLLWDGNRNFTGIDAFFKKLEAKNYKIQNRVMISRYRGKTLCPECQGSRLRKEANYVKIGGKSISDLLNISLNEVHSFFNHLTLSNSEAAIADRLLKEINNRIRFMLDVGLGYLTLNRRSNTLSGGESQRINLATSLGSSLVGSMYILDEPSIGLHSKDNERLIGVLKKLRNLGNTVIVVEHDEEIMQAADRVIDMGPEAGSLGGEIVAEGSLEEVKKANSLTAQYLTGVQKIPVPEKRKKASEKLEIIGARENNLKNIDVTIPLGGLTVVTGVSGSGKSTLVKKILYPALLRSFDIYTQKPGEYTELKGDVNALSGVEFVDQNPIGRSSRSNPVTYIKAYDEIRLLYAKQSLSKQRNYQPKHFSFNVDGGRCNECKGEGVVTIEMQFMADVVLECEHCKGKRFKKEIREVSYQGISIDQLLGMTVDDTIALFDQHNEKKLVNKLLPLQQVGLGYITLGQSSATLSGGEAQRIKLASFIGRGNTQEKLLFIFDEPTTGLHFHDIRKLLISFDALINKGHSILVVEHNLELIKCADHIIELGPEAGDEGGYCVGQGVPEEIIKIKASYTGQYLKHKLN
ncbi:MAG: UvrABC system protein A [Flavobacteriaceae bacterium]|mgnify:CR=1 FL=1|nr:MAG: UvrABC system protein A [Flavobacteriaceae bacterium]|tara:strand:- start:3564 stop:6344 length:2781 start_codon:yes stop_codon:yes gene_type:complete